jgi:hypothetical protein
MPSDYPLFISQQRARHRWFDVTVPRRPGA